MPPSGRAEVEAALALGATSRQAVAPILKTALRGALVPLVDATKTTGIIFLPGAMVGMIIAGADPLEAVELQIVVLYMLLGREMLEMFRTTRRRPDWAPVVPPLVQSCTFLLFPLCRGLGSALCTPLRAPCA